MKVHIDIKLDEGLLVAGVGRHLLDLSSLERERAGDLFNNLMAAVDPILKKLMGSLRARDTESDA